MIELFEGAYGPGTEQPLPIANSDWKVKVGSVVNKRRPEAIYIVMSSWVKPKINAVNALASSEFETDPAEIVLDIADSFKSELKNASRKFSGVFDSKLFNPSSILFTYDFAETRAAVGKSQYIELNLHIDTVNDIDDNDNPAAYSKDGKMYNLPFSAFVKALTDAVNKILKFEVFSKSTLMDFGKSKF